MDSKPAQNIQDTFLNTVRKDKTPITIYLVSGVKLTGRIRSFDKYSVLLENNSQEQLIFKHAISTVVSNRSVMHDHRLGHAVLGRNRRKRDRIRHLRTALAAGAAASRVRWTDKFPGDPGLRSAERARAVRCLLFAHRPSA